MLLLNHWFMYFPLFVGICVWSLFCYTLLCVLHSDEEEIAGCFALIVFLMYCDCWCFMAFPHDVVGWSAVFDGGTSWLYPLTFFKLLFNALFEATSQF